VRELRTLGSVRGGRSAMGVPIAIARRPRLVFLRPRRFSGMLGTYLHAISGNRPDAPGIHYHAWGAAFGLESGHLLRPVRTSIKNLFDAYVDRLVI
jgi:hypothetical protein